MKVSSVGLLLILPFAVALSLTPVSAVASYEAPIVGTLSGTSLYYVPPGNCDVILPTDRPGAGP